MCTRRILSGLSTLSLALVLGWPAATLAQEAHLQTQHTALREAVCAHAWEEAIALVDQMLTHPDLRFTDQQMLLDYRASLLEWSVTDDGSLPIVGCGIASASDDHWQRAVVMVRIMQPYWSGYCPGRGLYDFERSGGGSSRASSGGSSSGNCDNPNDRAADGSICGDRAASVRPGGR